MSFARAQRKKVPDHLIAFEQEVKRLKSNERATSDKFSYPETRLGTAGSRRSNSRSSSRSPSRALPFKIDEKLSPSSSVLNEKDKVNYKEVPGLDLRTAVSMDSLRNATAKDVGRVHELLVSASAIDCRADGVGSAGGHIARLVKAPGPHNGHNEIKENEKLLVSTSQDSLELMKQFSKESKAILQPVWDKTFAYVKSPCQRLEKLVSQTSVVKKQVQMLCTKYYVNNDDRSSVKSSSSSIITTNTMKNKIKQQKPIGNQNNNVEHIWNNKVNIIRRSSDDIKYLDLVDLTRTVDPDNATTAILGYVCILLGLKPTWEVIRTTIFSELPALFKLFKQLEPRSIPIKRLKKASKFKSKKISALTVIGGNQKTLLKILMWCNYVESISLLIKKVHKSCKEQGKLQSSSITSAEKTENHSAIESILEKQKQAHTKYDQIDYVCTLNHDEFLKELNYILINDKVVDNNYNRNNKNDDNSTIDTVAMTSNKDMMGSSLNSISSKRQANDDDDYENDYENEFDEDDNDSPTKSSKADEEREKIEQAQRQEAEERELAAKLEQEKLEAKKQEQERLEQERLEKEKAEEDERIAKEKEEERKIEEEKRLEDERIAKEKEERLKKIEEEKRLEDERIANEKEEQRKREQEKLEEEQKEKEETQKRIREFEEAKQRQLANDKKALEALSLIEAATGNDMLGLRVGASPGLLDDIVNTKPVSKKDDVVDKEQDDEYMEMAFEAYDEEPDSVTKEPTQEALKKEDDNSKVPEQTQEKKQPPLELQMGDKVEGNYKGKGTWYEGVISMSRGMDQYDIAYNDGERETWIPIDRIRLLQNTVAAKEDQDKSKPIEITSTNNDDIPAPNVLISPNNVVPPENDDYADDDFEA